MYHFPLQSSLEYSVKTCTKEFGGERPSQPMLNCTDRDQSPPSPSAYRTPLKNTNTKRTSSLTKNYHDNINIMCGSVPLITIRKIKIRELQYFCMKITNNLFVFSFTNQNSFTKVNEDQFSNKMGFFPHKKNTYKISKCFPKATRCIKKGKCVDTNFRKLTY